MEILSELKHFSGDLKSGLILIVIGPVSMMNKWTGFQMSTSQKIGFYLSRFQTRADPGQAWREVKIKPLVYVCTSRTEYRGCPKSGRSKIELVQNPDGILPSLSVQKPDLNFRHATVRTLSVHTILYIFGSLYQNTRISTPITK